MSALRCGETVTGLVTAAALVRPTGITGMEVKSLNDPAPMRTIKEATGIDYGVKYDPNAERRISYDLLERDYR